MRFRLAEVEAPGQARGGVLEGKPRTLGQIQGRMVTGAVKSLARLPEEPDTWTQSNDQTYRRCQTILRDAKALGLIRFGDAEKDGKTPPIKAADGYLTQIEERKSAKREKTQETEGAVNDGASSSAPDASEESGSATQGEA